MFTALPAEVEAVFREFRVCEFSTLGKDGTLVTSPMVGRYQPEQSRFLFTTAIGSPFKAFNIRRDPRVSMLYSDPTASGLDNPPAVLVQGKAVAPDKIITSVEGLEKYWRDSIFRRQPPSETMVSTLVMRWLMDWHFMRVIISVTPTALYWWPGGDFSQPVRTVEVGNVG